MKTTHQPRVFISYRRGDTPGHALLVRNGLEEHFGPGHVFMDIATIAPGTDFSEAIADGVGSSDVLLAMIGRDWLTATDEHGRRRLDDPDDFVATEIRSALERKVRVIPLLVEGASMPSGPELPESLRRLARLQAVEMSDARWDYDMRRLIDALAAAAARSPAEKQPPRGAAVWGSPSGTSAEPARPRARSRDGELRFAAPGLLAASRVLVVSGAVVAVGGVLPWMRSTYTSARFSHVNERIGIFVHNNLGLFTTVLGVVLVVLGFVVLRRQTVMRLHKMLWMLSAAAVLGATTRKLVIAGSAIEYKHGVVELEPLFGLYVVLCGAAVATTTAVVLLTSQRAVERRAQSAGLPLKAAAK